MHHAETDGPRRSWAVLAVALTAQILVVLDISVVNTALPSIGASLNLRSGDLQWLVTAYLIMSGGGLLLGGRIADLLSRRRVFLTGLTVFTIASLLSGFAGNATELIAARATQGLSAALMTPAALSLIMTTYSGAQRRNGLALWGAVGSMGVAAGVLVGGALTTWAGWQAIFWINGPIGAVALLAAVKVLPNARASLTPASSSSTCPARSPSWRSHDAHVRPRRHRDQWLVVGPHHRRRSAVSAVLLTAFVRHRTPRRQAADPAAHLEGPLTRVGHNRHARHHRHPRRRRVPHLHLPPERARLLRPARRDWRSCPSRSPSPPALRSPVTCSATSHRATSP